MRRRWRRWRQWLQLGETAAGVPFSSRGALLMINVQGAQAEDERASNGNTAISARCSPAPQTVKAVRWRHDSVAREEERGRGRLRR